MPLAIGQAFSLVELIYLRLILLLFWFFSRLLNLSLETLKITLRKYLKNL